MNKYFLFTFLSYLIVYPLFICSQSSTGARPNSNFNRFKTSAQAQYNKFKSSNAVKNIKTYGGAAVGAVGGGVLGVAKGGVKSIYHVGRATGNILQGNVKQAGKHLGYAIDAPLTKGFLGAQKGFALGKEGFSGQKIKNGLSKAGDKIKNTGIGLGQGFAEARNAFSRQNVKDAGFISTVGKGIDTVLVGGSQGYNTKSTALPFGWKAPIDGNKVNVKVSEATQPIKKQSKFNNVLNGAKDSFKAGLTQFKDWTASLKTKKSPSQDVNSPSVPSINQGNFPSSEQLAKQPQVILKNPNNNPPEGNVHKVEHKVTFDLKNDATRSSSPDTLSKIGVEASPVIPPRVPSPPASNIKSPPGASNERKAPALPPRENSDPSRKIEDSGVDVSSNFKWEVIKDSAQKARERFQSDPNLAATRVNGVKFIREPVSGKIFALASNKLHDNAIVGKGSFGVIKNAIDIDNPTASVVVKRPLRKGVYPSHDKHGLLNPNFDLVPEAPKLKALDLQYANLDQPLRFKRLKNFEWREKQYLPQIKAGGDQIFKTFHNSNDPKEIKVAIDSGLQALDRLHNKGFIHRDAHLGNVLFDKTAGKATLIDPGRVMEARKGTIHDPIYDKLNFLGNVISALSTKGTDAQSLKYARDKFIQLKYQRDPRLDGQLFRLENRVGNFLYYY